MAGSVRHVRPAKHSGQADLNFKSGMGCIVNSTDHSPQFLIELDDGKIYRKPLYLMVKTMVSG